MVEVRRTSPMSFFAKLRQGCETRWVFPDYSGWVLMGLAAFFFAAATNTLAGWLYVISGMLLALVAIATLLPPRHLKGLRLQRAPIRPVSAGDSLQLEITVQNATPQPKAMVQLQDQLPLPLALAQTAIPAISSQGRYVWRYAIAAPRRGIYCWQTLRLRTAAPLGLFWCQRRHQVPATAIVYPQTLPLSRCPAVDSLGETQHWHSAQRIQPASEGLTRALRPYRWGDPTRLIHWRSSARYGELRVRELERGFQGRQVTIALNTADAWEPEAFEQAVIAAASLYVYALRCGYGASLWTPEAGMQREGQTRAAQGHLHSVLTRLAEIQPTTAGASPPAVAMIWLTMAQLPAHLPSGYSLCWGASTASHLRVRHVDSTQPLQPQLQALT